MKPSKYQQAIFDFVQNGSGSAVVEAVAGSGKTTTVVKSLELIPEAESVLLLAFNKSIADELKRKVPERVDVKTFNGLGHNILGKKFGKLELDARKLRTLVKGQLGAFDYKAFGGNVVDLVGFARRFGLLPQGMIGKALMVDAPESWAWLIDHFGLAIERDYRQVVIDCARLAIRASIDLAAEKRIIDFDDQIYIPAVKGVACDQYDWVIVDEAQDVSPVRTRLVEMALKPGGRLLAVGDSRQAIYGFTGSDSEAMDTLRGKFSAISLPLSISYRCAKKVVAAAQEVMPTIEASETAPEGEVQMLGAWSAEDFQGGDMILCRKNSPIVALAWRLLGQGIPCRILGRDIAGGLVSLIEALQPKGLNGKHGLEEKLGAWRAAEIQKWSKEDREDMVEAVKDKAACVFAIMARTTVKTVPDLIRSIEAMFVEAGANEKAVSLCSMHKSKGLEADRVFILDVGLLPIKCAKQDWQVKQEVNLKYVAFTRAKKSLFFIQTENMVESSKLKKAG